MSIIQNSTENISFDASQISGITGLELKIFKTFGNTTVKKCIVFNYLNLNINYIGE